MKFRKIFIFKEKYNNSLKPTLEFGKATTFTQSYPLLTC